MSASQRNARITSCISITYAIPYRMFASQWRKDDPRMEEAVGVAQETLVKCADLFDPTAGVQFITYAWKSIEHNLRRFARRQRRSEIRETTALNSLHAGGDTDGADDGFDLVGKLAAQQGLAGDSPEEQLIDAQARATGEDRLRRLDEKQRATIETLLEGQGGCVGYKSFARAAGVRVSSLVAPVSLADPERKKATGAERTRSWYARLTPEKKAMREAARRARRQAARAA